MVKIRLLNDGGYDCTKGLVFPISVYAEMFDKIGFDVSFKELRRIGANIDDLNDGDLLFWQNDDVEILNETLAPSTPQTTDIYVNCAGIEEVSCGSGGFKQHVHLSEVCVEDIIQNIGPDTFFNAFDNEELAEHLRKYGYEVKKND